MSSSTTGNTINQHLPPRPARAHPLLPKLSATAAGLLSPCLEFTQLAADQKLEVPGRTIKHLYLPDTALVCFSAIGFGTPAIEVATIGQGCACSEVENVEQV